MGVSLNPLDPGPREGGSPPLRYPDDLATTTLQGYLGEVFAGLIAENFDPHHLAWSVPAFLFRTHSVAAQTLERRRQLGGPATPIPGRTGDDALAFAKDPDGRIVAWLFGEAKCTHDHDSALINAGHEQLSAAVYRPVDLTALIDILHPRPMPNRSVGRSPPTPPLCLCIGRAGAVRHACVCLRPPSQRSGLPGFRQKKPLIGTAGVEIWKQSRCT